MGADANGTRTWELDRGHTGEQAGEQAGIHAGEHDVSEDRYVEMLARSNTALRGFRARPASLPLMFEHFGLDARAWSRISTAWLERLAGDPRLGARVGERFVQRMHELDDAWTSAQLQPA